MANYDFISVRKEITYEQLRKLRDKVFKIPRSGLDVEIVETRDIVDSDFDDLEVLYEKCKNLHFRKLTILLSSLRLEPEEMSELIPTSGTIWLPWVARQAGDRSHTRTIVLGVNFAPNFVRIGIDFGSEAYKAKETYYTLLLKGKLDSQLSKLTNDYYFIDTFWYFNIRDLRLIREYWPSKIDEIRPKIETALEETIVRRKAQAPMKGHQSLMGKVFKRGTKEFSDFLIKIPETIQSVFCDLFGIVKQVEQSQKVFSIT